MVWTAMSSLPRRSYRHLSLAEWAYLRVVAGLLPLPDIGSPISLRRFLRAITVGASLERKHLLEIIWAPKLVDSISESFASSACLG